MYVIVIYARQLRCHSNTVTSTLCHILPRNAPVFPVDRNVLAKTSPRVIRDSSLGELRSRESRAIENCRTAKLKSRRTKMTGERKDALCETIPIRGGRVSGKTHRVARGASNENGGMERVLQDFDSSVPGSSQSYDPTISSYDWILVTFFVDLSLSLFFPFSSLPPFLVLLSLPLFRSRCSSW